MKGILPSLAGLLAPEVEVPTHFIIDPVHSEDWLAASVKKHSVGLESEASVKFLADEWELGENSSHCKCPRTSDGQARSLAKSVSAARPCFGY
jgi:hypothetical protein